MRPLTDHTPKPLLEAGGKALIVHQIERLRQAGLTEIVINLGWLGEQIEHALGDGAAHGVRIEYSIEPPGALETAGGIVHALARLGNSPFLVTNADIYCDFPLARLRQFEPEGLAHLVMIENPSHHSHGDFALGDGRLRLSGEPRLTYSGIGVFRPEMFRDLSPGVRPLRPVLEAAIARGQISAELHRGQWLDIGTPDRLQQLAASFASSVPVRPDPTGPD